MEKHQHPFDDFLKESLKGHQLVPPEKARKAFLEEASGIIRARKTWNNWYYLPLLVIFISGLVAVIYFRNHHEKASSIPSAGENQPTAFYTVSTDTTSAQTEASSTLSNLIKGSNKPGTMNHARPVAGTTAETQKSAVSLPVNQYTTAEGDSLPPAPEQSASAPDSAIIAQTVKIDTAVPVSTPSSIENPPANLPGKNDIPGQEDAAAAVAPYVVAGVYYLPELMFNTLEDNKFVNNFGFEATFYRGPVSIRTGAGISVSKGTTENAVQYNDYLGSYNKLDSITFIFSESEHNFIPNMYLSSEKVWDSVSKLDSASIIKRYTYLQVPLVLGFDFWRKSRFSLGVRVGTIMSVQLKSKQLTGEYDPGENQVIGINVLTPEHVSINWQALGGINASVRLRKDIYFEFEPQARYYYQSIYEKSDLTKKPWSVGVRCAVTYKF